VHFHIFLGSWGKIHNIYFAKVTKDIFKRANIQGAGQSFSAIRLFQMVSSVIEAWFLSGCKEKKHLLDHACVYLWSLPPSIIITFVLLPRDLIPDRHMSELL
jgi:hypothetical protein